MPLHHPNRQRPADTTALAMTGDGVQTASDSPNAGVAPRLLMVCWLHQSNMSRVRSCRAVALLTYPARMTQTRQRATRGGRG